VETDRRARGGFAWWGPAIFILLVLGGLNLAETETYELAGRDVGSVDVAGFRITDDGTYRLTLAGRHVALNKTWQVRGFGVPEMARMSEGIRTFERSVLKAVAAPWSAAWNWLRQVARNAS